ncbi:MAG TPA: redoxin domain-containing protein [Urbifossiella sp.]|nr:redoxin domain-containing protein [Urbifossiella sp.]
MSRKRSVRLGFYVVVLGAMPILGWQLRPEAVPPTPSAEPPATLEGSWRCTGVEADGKTSPGWMVEARRLRLTIAGERLVFTGTFEADTTFSLPGSPAKAIDIRTKTDEGKVFVIPGIVSLEGGILQLGFAFDPDRPRPVSTETRAGDAHVVYTFERIKSGEGLSESAAEKLGAVLKEARQGNPLPVDKAGRLAAQCLKIAESRPGTDEEVVSLLWVLANSSEGESAKAALALLRNGGIERANVETLALCFGLQRGTIGPGHIPDQFNLELAPLLLARVRRTPDHPKAAELLSSVCGCFRGQAAVDVPPVFDEAVRLIAERWATSPDLTHFLEALSALRQRTWSSRYEATVRLILTRTPDAYIRYRAAFTLAQLVAETGEARQEEARDLYARFVESYRPGVVDRSWEGVTEDLVDQARRELEAMLVRGIGGSARDLLGTDLDGRPLSLGAYRGKTVLLSFWATWCGPCMRLVPHERILVKQLADRPFALLGVNGDEADKFEPAVLRKHGITWRSFRNTRPNQKTIAEEWNLTAWPTLYLIDHTGTIRRRWIGTPPLDELDHEVERWVAVAEGKPLPPAFRPGNVAAAPTAWGVPATFFDKVHTDERLGESRYAVCLPEGYDGTPPLPVMLFLHGSGQVGTDNTKQLGVGLGPAVRERGMPFPFIGVFPQAREGPWLAGGSDGKRALAILKAVEREFPTAKNRVYLTGISMGAEGVWSLAAAHPKRFAAIVPMCGGGAPTLAASLKDTPCWAFHGDADTVVPVQASRDLIQAITKAGGRPRYQEYRGLDHNCWDRAYGETELYRWLQAQSLD